MHEMPIVLSVVDNMDGYAEMNNIDQISGVKMEIGELSPVVPDYFRSFWQYAVSRSKHLKQAELLIDVIPGIVRCSDCGKMYNLPQNDGICPDCESNAWTLISGRQVQIKEIYVE